MEIPAELARTQGSAFVAALPARAADFLKRWELRRTGPAMHGMCALVLPVERADGTPAVLKLQDVDSETAGEPVALRVWGGDGAVRLLEYDEESGTLLLERLDATQDLSGVPVRDGVSVIAGLLARLTAAPAPAGLRRLGEIAEAMLDETPVAVRSLADDTQRRLLLDCAAAVREVAGEPGDRLLHWDLHFENVLAPLPAAGGPAREPWLAIDPKPLAGDPGFELLPALVNRFDEGDILGRFDLMTEVIGLDRGRARAWTLGRVLQNCLWDIREGERVPDPTSLAVGRALLAR
ncbi:aminoglycoside phosphotransferase family protein [Streptomyces niveus]|uniref:aminoglycoside phosphotransferase family protein n=1 Tax=Streptomyces TaxID=1883 RepID=UPI00107299E6|nr:aminoglycoside phosphotransferase family protein [Streptomyces sp. 4R-3d]TFI28128.1 hydroxyurea phosphotransferase [Streptomyces sp. 4R-3d]